MKIRLVISYLILTVMSIFVLFPVAWIIAYSFRVGSSLLSTHNIPRQITVDNYRNLLHNPRNPFLLWTLNTIKISIITTLLVLLVVTLGAYVLSRFRFTGRRALLMTLLVLQMFPGTLSMVAIYALLNTVNLLDTHLGLILVYAGSGIPFATWLVKGYMDSIPISLDEAALLDGATHLQIFSRITFPLCAPTLAVIGLLNFIGPFSEYLLARLVLLTPEKTTLAVGLHQFISNQYGQNWTQFAAGAVLTAIPITILFLFLQRHFIHGLTAGATKG